jgi:AbrB family looped-hinge helix DNA binding protein
MQQIVSITSKNQITLPVKITRLLNINRGDRLVIKVESGRIIMEKAQQLLDDLAGSLYLPKKYRNKSLSYIVKEAKKEYFTSKK